MADDNRGGYRRPAHPAPVSGPGTLSRRTDGKQPLARIPDAAYGEQKAYQEQQQGAPVAASNPVAAAQGQVGPNINVIPFSVPSQQPNTPVTDGADAGEGVGLASLGLSNPDVLAAQEDTRWAADALPILEWYANRPFASPGIRSLVRRIKGSLM